jgi:hypothetical protein
MNIRRIMTLSTTLAIALLCALAASVADAAFHLYRIDQLYSNADGTVQFVVLREGSGADGENLWAGHSLEMSGPAGMKTFVFPGNLPSSATAGTRVLVATPGFAALGLVAPDFIMPANFLSVAGGTLNYAGVHQVTYSALPTDGVNALSSTGTVVPNVATNFAGASASVTAGPVVATVIEYYHAALDHYFITDRANEIAILDAGITIRGWLRTGQTFNVFTSAGAGTSPVCRFYIPPDKGDSHFFGRGVTECDETAAKFPSFINEDPQFFHVILPTAGVCPAGTRPVYRVFSNRPDANHRYMVDPAIRNEMVTVRHWLAEGDGPDLVVMCVPPPGVQATGAPGVPGTPGTSPPVEPMPGLPGYP